MTLEGSVSFDNAITKETSDIFLRQPQHISKEKTRQLQDFYKKVRDVFVIKRNVWTDYTRGGRTINLKVTFILLSLKNKK